MHTIYRKNKVKEINKVVLNYTFNLDKKIMFIYMKGVLNVW